MTSKLAFPIFIFFVFICFFRFRQNGPEKTLATVRKIEQRELALRSSRSPGERLAG